MSIIEKLIALRKKRGLSIYNVADLSGLKASTINRMENERFVPKLNTIIQVTEALGAKLEIKED